VALDRQSIERHDFPISANGYDPAAVDAHLRQVATEVEQRRRGETLASSASEQVRAILEAAENSAAEIQRQATTDASDYLAWVSTSIRTMLERVDGMRSELSALLEGLPLQRDVAPAAQPQLVFEREPASTPAPEIEPEAVVPATTASEPEPGGDDLAGGFRATGSAGAASPPSDSGDDTEGARLIALNMAQNGTSREETDRYLSENFSLSDRASLLDEIYASVEN
jgi:DivIVA domain-containing protein